MAQKAAKLETFLWEGTDRKGRRVRGENEAPSAAFVSATLRRQGIKPLKVRKRAKPLFVIKKKIKPKDVAIFTRQLATMITAGIPVAQAIDVIGKGHDNARMQEMLIAIRQDVESGTNLSAALAKFPLYFDDLYQNLVGAGEQSGTLDALLEKVAAYKEKIEAIKGKIKSALFYPAAIIIVAIVVTSILLLFVIPQFETLFKGFGAELPTLTQVVLGVSRFMQSWWWLMAILLIGSIVGIVFSYKRSAKMRHTVDRLSLKIPVIGAILHKATIARFTRTLSTMFSAGVPLVEALDSVAGASGNRVYYEGIMNIKAEVSTGRSLESAMTDTGLFPNMVLQMVGIGEESGELDAMLGKVADFYEREVDDAVAALSSLIEPIIMAILGSLIGTLVIAMYLPIFKMAAVF